MDFDNLSDSNVLGVELETTAAPSRGEDVESLLQRYHAEQNHANRRNMTRRLKGSAHGLANGVSSTSQDTRVEASASTGHGALPPLIGGANPMELERIRVENAELREVVAELRQVLEANDPQVWEHQRQEAERLIAERDQEIATLRAFCEEFNQKLQTHRLVPADDDLAEMADELEKERCQTAQERRKLEEEKRQLKEDEESLMKQMREMEVSMARDRAEIARQRTEMQRLQNEVHHELELLQRGDAAVKERLAQFQRRSQDAAPRAPVAPPAAPQPPTQTPSKPKDSTVFKRLFGQG